MDGINRRHALALGAGFAAGVAFPGVAAAPAADIPAPKLAHEAGATLRVLRPAKFVDPDEAIFTANSKKFADQTGTAIRVDYLAWDNMPAQLAVVANTGAGPDIVCGFGPDPHVYAEKVLELTDI